MIEKILESSVQESNISKINSNEIHSRKTTVSEIPQKEIAELKDFVARNKANVATRNMAMSRQKKLDKMTEELDNRFGKNTIFKGSSL